MSHTLIICDPERAEPRVALLAITPPSQLNTINLLTVVITEPSSTLLDHVVLIAPKAVIPRILLLLSGAQITASPLGQTAHQGMLATELITPAITAPLFREPVSAALPAKRSTALQGIAYKESGTR